MSLRALHQAAPPTRPCKVRRLIDDLEGDDRDWLEEALASTDTSSAIVRTLTGAGYPISHSPLWRHRINECSCGGAGVATQAA